MDQRELEGLRLLSFDGGDLRAVSQLIILDEFMRRLKCEAEAENPKLPCEYFHMMAGVGTGGIIIFLLVVLRMSIEEAIEEFITIWHTVYMDAALEPRARSIKLENVLKDLLRRKEIEENQVFSTHNSGCKAFVCAAPESNLVLCEKFRNYKSKETSTTPTIVEAVRATCAIPTLFTPVTIESVGCELSYTTGAFKFNNPAGELLKEACEHLGRNTRVACMLSLGCASLSAHQNSITDLTSGIVLDGELLDMELAWRIGRSGAYYRLSARQQIQSLEKASSDSIKFITATTQGFLAHPDVVEKVNQSVAASRRRGGVPLAEISGRSERKPAAAHGLPSFSASFVERPALIKKMAGYLLQRGPPAQRTIVLSGLGGIGKTQITISFLLQFLAIFRHVLFIDGSSVQTIESGLVAKVKSLGSAYSRVTAKEALDVLENPDHEITRDWAIVYDNVDDPRVRIATYFPKCAFGTIFITTRNPKLGNLTPNAHLHLDIMSEEEAVEVLLKSAIRPPRKPTDEEQKHAREISKELGYLPVALVQAGYFIQSHDCMGDYPRRLRKRRLDILKRPAEHQRDDHYHGVYATLEVTWPYLSDRAQNFMSILGFVNYTGFPLVLISRVVLHGFLFEPFAFISRADTFQETVELLCTTFMPQEEWDQQDIDDLVEELERYSLVTRMSTFMVNTLRLHPLVHSWVHDRLSNTEKEVYQAAAVRLLVCGTGDANEDIFEFIYPHVTSWSTRFGSMHLNDLGGLARISAHQGDHATAIAVWEHIFRETSKKHGVGDLRTSEAKLQLAASYRKPNASEHMTAAAAMEREVVEQHTRTLGPADPVTVRALTQQARGMAQRWNQREEAISILRRVVAFWRGWAQADRESVLQAKEALASALFKQSAQEYALFKPGEPNMAEVMQIYTEILQDRMAHEGNDHHATVKATENLAAVYERYTSYSWGENRPTVDGNAVELWTSAVSARTKRRGTHHPDTLDAMEHLALSCYFQGSCEMFVEKWTHLFVLRRNAQGASHEKVAAMKKRLVEMQSARSDHAEGHILRKGVISLMIAIHGCAHRDTVNVVRRFARECEAWSQYEEAIGWLKESLAMLKEIQGPLHEDTLNALENLANDCERWGQYGEAIIQRKEVLASRKEIQGANHKDTLACMESLARTYHMGGQHEMAITQWKDVIAQTKELLGSTHTDTIETMERVARECGRWRQYEGVVEWWKEVLALRKRIQGPRHEDTLNSMKNLAAVCEIEEQYEEAIIQRKELLALQKEIQGTHSRDTLACMESLARTYHMGGRHKMATTLWNDVMAQTKELYESVEDIERSWSFARQCEEWCGHKGLEWWKETLALQKGLQGTNHEDTIACMESLAWTYYFCGQHEMAITKWKDIVVQIEELHGHTHEETIKCIERVARQCGEWWDHKGAIEWWKETLALQKEIQGANHDDTLACMESLARTYHMSGQHEMAITQWKDVIAQTKELLGSTHTDTIETMERVARECGRWRQYEGAVEWWKEALALRKEIEETNHKDTIACMESLARTYYDCGQYEMAITQWKDAVLRTKELYGRAHEETINCMRRLAQACGHYYKEARAQWEEILGLLKETRGPRHEDTLEAMEGSATACEDLQDCDEALVQQVLALRKEIQGISHEDTLNCMESFAWMYMRLDLHGEARAQWQELIDVAGESLRSESAKRRLIWLYPTWDPKRKFDEEEWGHMYGMDSDDDLGAC